MLLTENVINHIRPLLLHKSVQLLKVIVELAKIKV